MVELVNPLNAYRDTYSLLDGIAQDRAKRTAGNALAKGDYGSAQNALYKRGMLDEGAAVGTMQQGRQDRQAQMDAAQKKEALDRLEWTGKALDGLSTLQDPAQRKAAYTEHLRPVLAQMGVPPEELAKIDASDFSDATLQQWKAVTGQEAQKLQIVASGGGGYSAVDPTTGKPVYTQAPSVFENDKTYVDYGNGQPAPAAPAATAPAQTDPAQAGGDNYLARLGQVESNNNPNAKNGSSTGLYQFHPDTFARLIPGGNINDPAQQKDAALKLAQESAQTLQQAGVPVDDANLYIMHQQGSGGGLALLKADPGANAIQTLTPVYGNPTRARQAIVNNGGTPDMTAGQFVQMWRQKWGRGAQQAQTQPYQVASNGDTPPPPSGLNLPTGARVIHAATPKPKKPEDDTTVDPNIVKALIEGRITPPTQKAAATPFWQAQLRAATAQDQTFDGVNFQSRAKARADFTSGKSAQNITALNTVIGHLDHLDRAIDGLGNYGGFPGSQLNNKAAHAIANASGTNARYKDFETAKSAVANELTRVFRGTGGAEADIQDWMKKLDTTDSPEALHAVVQSMATLIKSRIEAVGEQYKQGMGTTKDPITLLTPDKQKAFNRLMGGSGGGGTKPSPQSPGVIRYDAQGRRIK